VEFRILGPLTVLAGDAPIALGTPRQRALLALLVVQAGELVTYDRLAEDLWNTHPPHTARHTLQTYAHRLRSVLDAEAWRLETRPFGYQLKASDDEVDARRFEHLAEAGRRALVRGDPQTASAALAEAIGLWRGKLLEDLADLAALDPERARLEALRLTAVEDRLDADLALGHHATLIPELEALLTEDPFRERLWGQLMIARYRAGRQADALETFGRARQVLADELGVEPGRWLCRVQQQILLQDPALDAPDPLPAPHHNLPTPRSTFVGRRRELAALEGLLRTRRLVTVTGPPGAGKTRLAIEVATRMVPSWPHGVFFVPLAELDDARLVPSAIAVAIGVARVTDEPVLDTLAEHLRSRRLLLLLDNVEHVLDAAAEVARLLDAAAGVAVLATSRARLRLDGEQEYPLDPLPLSPPDDHRDDPTGGDAVALFADRAAAVDPRLTIGPDDIAVVADMVARLDGLPLAIELAAARLRLFPLDELRRRLGPCLPLLTDGVVDHPDRQRTLRSAIAWSDDLLDPKDRALFRRLAVFRGGITADAAEATAAGAPIEDVVGRLARLVEASLLFRPADTDPPRFGMLETIREYATEQLREAGEEHETRARHADFHAAFVNKVSSHLTQADQAGWLERLDAEQPDLRAALRWAIAASEADLALGMAAGLWRYWQLRGHLAEGRQWLEEALAIAGASTESTVRALLGLAGICYWQFDLDAAEVAYHRVRDMARGLDDWWIELEALFGLVVTMACHRGDTRAAASLEEEFQALAAERQDPMAMGLGLATSQMMRLLAGELEESRRYGELCLAGTREVGERWYEVQVLRTLALTSLRAEQYDRARDELAECLQIALELGDLLGMAMDLDRLGQVAAILGEPERACVLAGAAERLRESVGEVVTVKAFRWEQEPAPVTARRSLADNEIERALARGRTMTVEQVVAYGRASDEPDPPPADASSSSTATA
jgi:predicted ATPase